MRVKQVLITASKSGATARCMKSKARSSPGLGLSPEADGERKVLQPSSSQRLEKKGAKRLEKKGAKRQLQGSSWGRARLLYREAGVG